MHEGKTANVGDDPLVVADIARLFELWPEGVDASQDSVTIDLGSGARIHLELLAFLIGFLVRRARLGLSSALELPPEGDSLEFIRSWQFLEQLSWACGCSIDELLTERSRDLLRTQTSPPKYLKVAASQRGRESVLSMNFFSFQPAIGSTASAAANSIRVKFENDRVQTVLSRSFGRNADRLGKVVVQESIVNAGLHPGASRVLYASQFPQSSNSELSLTIWDDGTPIVETLLNALSGGGTIYAPAFGAKTEEIAFTIRPDGGGLDPSDGLYRDRISTADPQHRISREHLLLSAFFLGVTREPDQGSSRWAGDIEEELADLVPPKLQHSSGLGDC